ncbi:MAG: tRNA (adenosine(37)-N6)-dimethylallyltransferase MiaA [Patescibacteria group bacterium]
MKYNKLLAIIGSTGTGKTKLAVRLAHAYNGEIVSADSRQVYRGMDVGTGKDLKDFRFQIPARLLAAAGRARSDLRFKNIPYHCIDVVSPKTEFNLAKYIKCAHRAIRDVQSRGRLPILVGGTGLYAQAVVDGYDLTDVKPDKKLREKLEKMSIEKLQKLLQKLDRNYDGDLSNKRYLIRYIEMVKQTGEPVKKLLAKQGSKYDCLVLGIKFSREVINKRIDKRLAQRIEQEGMIEEVERLHKEGVSWKRLESFGLEYKFVSRFLRDSRLRGNDDKTEMIEKLKIASHQFAKRQMTWYRRWEKQGREIKWVDNYKKANKLVKDWIYPVK